MTMNSLIVMFVLVTLTSSIILGFNQRGIIRQKKLFFNQQSLIQMASTATTSQKDPDVILTMSDEDRKQLWKSISELERKAVDLLIEKGEETDEIVKLLAESVSLKKRDPFLQLANQYSDSLASEGSGDTSEELLSQMKRAGLPPHLKGLVSRKMSGSISSSSSPLSVLPSEEEVIDPGSVFSDTVTEKVRVKVNSYFDSEKSDPANGKYMFWYKVAIFNEGPEPVQVVARMWEIEKFNGEKDVVRGAGIMSTQPIIAPGDVFTYQSVCPLKVFPPRGKRLMGSMSGAYTMCKGNMGQHNFTVKVAKFNLILPEPATA